MVKMKKNMNILAIVPARGGSKGLPNKNILPLAGHPLIAYSIKAAKESSLINRTIVSTDFEKIADVSLHYGAEIPFMRPSKFAGDLSTDYDVFVHALNWLAENENYHPDIVVQLRPTSPVRTVEIIDNCIQKLIDSDADSVRIVTKSPITPYKMWRIEDENKPMCPLLSLEGVPEPFNQPRQNLPQTYWQIGFIDVIRTSTIIEKKSMSGSKILPYIVDNEFSVDIDDITSFELAAKIISKSNKYVQF